MGDLFKGPDISIRDGVPNRLSLAVSPILATRVPLARPRSDIVNGIAFFLDMAWELCYKRSRFARKGAKRTLGERR